MATANKMPGQNRLKNFLLLALSMGTLSVLKAISSALGSGIWLSIQMPIMSIGTKTKAAQNGIQVSLILNC